MIDLKNKKFNAKKHKQDNAGYLFTAPMLLLYMLSTVVPLICLFIYSFTYYNLSEVRFIGFDNYIKMFTDDPLFYKSLFNTVKYMCFTIIPSMILGLIFAVILNDRVPGRVFFRAAIYSTNILSTTAISLAWLFIYDGSYGVLNAILNAFGLSGKSWLFEPDYAFFCIIILGIWNTMGYNMVIYLSGLQSISGSIYEAATIDGASGFDKFRYISVPLLRPTTFFLFVMGCISSFQVFDQVFIMTSGGPMNTTTTLVMQLYRNAFVLNKFGYASAQAVILFLFILGITILNFKFGDTSDKYDVA